MLRLRKEYASVAVARVVDINLTLGDHAHDGRLSRGAGESQGRAVVNIASMYAHSSAPLSPAYAASKVRAATDAVVGRRWAEDGIRVNAIAPGWIQRPMTVPAVSDAARNRAILDRTPLGRWGTPDDIVGAGAVSR